MTVSERFIDLPTVRIACTVHERPGVPVIVLAHAVFFDHRMFDTLAKLLSEDFTVVTYDARGHGASGHAIDERYDVDSHYDDAAGLIEALGMGPVHLVGNSMGGFTALRVAARRPDLVRTATAIGSSGSRETKIEEFGGLVTHLAQHGGAGIEDTLTYVFFGDDTLADQKLAPIVATWRAHFANLPQSMSKLARGVVHRASVLGELAHTPVPILALAGGQDHAYPLEFSEAIVQAAPNARLEVIPNVGHVGSLEQPEQVAAALRTFIASQS